MKRRLTAFAVSAGLALAPIPSLAAQDSGAQDQTAPTTLQPGPAADVKTAQFMDRKGLEFIATGLLLAGGVALIISHGRGTVSTTTTH
jgi:hypothetical protein